MRLRLWKRFIWALSSSSSSRPSDCTRRTQLNDWNRDYRRSHWLTRSAHPDAGIRSSMMSATSSAVQSPTVSVGTNGHAPSQYASTTPRRRLESCRTEAGRYELRRRAQKGKKRSTPSRAMPDSKVPLSPLTACTPSTRAPRASPCPTAFCCCTPVMLLTTSRP